MATRKFSGRKFLLIIVSFFLVVIGANLSLVYAALGTFPGLEVNNTYVASQNFNSERAAQINLGWRAKTAFDGKMLTLEILDKTGKPARVTQLQATVGRAAYDRADQTLTFAEGASPYQVPVKLAPGKWEVRFVATAPDGEKFRQRLPIYVKP